MQRGVLGTKEALPAGLGAPWISPECTRVR